MLALISWVLIALGTFLFVPPEFDELPIRVQQFLEHEAEGFGIDSDGRIFCRANELEYREAVADFRESGRRVTTVDGGFGVIGSTRDTEAWAVTNQDLVATDPPPLWMYVDGQGPERILFVRGEAMNLIHLRIVQVLENNEALFQANWWGVPGDQVQLRHVDNLPSGLIDNYRLETEGYLVPSELRFTYTDTQGAQRTVDSFTFYAADDIRITGEQLYNAYRTGEAIRWKCTYKSRRPTRDERDRGIESAFQWQTREIRFTAVDRLLSQSDQ